MSKHDVEKLAKDLDESRKATLRGCREAGVKQVEVVAAEDDRTCEAVWEYDAKYFDIEAVPDLPVPGCDAEYCRCVYAAVIE